MRIAVLTLSMALFLFGPIGPAVAAEQTTAAQSEPRTVTLEVQNMTCPLCEFTVGKALKSVEGVIDVSVDVDAKSAKVTFDPQSATVDDLIKASTNAGYPASLE